MKPEERHLARGEFEGDLSFVGIEQDIALGGLIAAFVGVGRFETIADDFLWASANGHRRCAEISANFAENFDGLSVDQARDETGLDLLVGAGDACTGARLRFGWRGDFGRSRALADSVNTF